MMGFVLSGSLVIRFIFLSFSLLGEMATVTIIHHS